MGSTGWFRNYAKAIVVGWRGWGITAVTLLGGVPGAYYLAKEANLSLPAAVLGLLLALSILLCVRQAFVWKGENATRKSAEAGESAAQIATQEAREAERVARLAQQRAEAELQRVRTEVRYTSDGLSWEPIHQDPGPAGYRMLVNISPDFRLPQPLTLYVRCSTSISRAIPTLYGDRRHLEVVGRSDLAAEIEVDAVVVSIGYPKLSPPALLALVLESDSREPFEVKAVERPLAQPDAPPSRNAD